MTETAHFMCYVCQDATSRIISAKVANATIAMCDWCRKIRFGSCVQNQLPATQPKKKGGA